MCLKKGQRALVDRQCAQYSLWLPVNICGGLMDAVAKSGTSSESRRFTRMGRGRDATNGRRIRGSSPLTDGSVTSMIKGCHGNVTPSKK